MIVNFLSKNEFCTYYSHFPQLEFQSMDLNIKIDIKIVSFYRNDDFIIFQSNHYTLK